MSPRRDDRGTAIVEFIVLGIGVLVPVAYLALSAATVQAAAFASSQAAREAGRAFVMAATPDQARRLAQTAAELAFADQGLALPDGALRLACSGACLSPGSAVEATIAWSVRLPWLPIDAPAPTIALEAAQVVPVDDFRSDADAV